jgi:VWFA-related protein
VFSAEAVPTKLAHPLPDNAFTNRFDLKGQGAGSVTVVLFDALNTSGPDQIYVRKQVLRFRRTLKPEDHVAIYALTTQLFVLHDASNPEKVDLVDMAGSKDWLGFQNALNNVNAMIADRNTIDRATRTSAAIQAIANHVAAIPGQKSLIWVSGGFPIQIGTVPIGRTDIHNLNPGEGSDPRTASGVVQYSPVGGEDPTNKLPHGDRESASLEPDINRAALALNRVNIAIYPVDARGVELDSATSPDKRSSPTSQDSSTFIKEQESRDSSKLLADRTGGKAFFGSNDLSEAMHRAIDDGRHGYTIGYYPDHEKWNGKFYHVKVIVRAEGAQLRYRQGHIAVPYHPERKGHQCSATRSGAEPLEATAIGMIVEGKLPQARYDFLAKAALSSLASRGFAVMRRKMLSSSPRP